MKILNDFLQSVWKENHEQCPPCIDKKQVEHFADSIFKFLFQTNALLNQYEEMASVYNQLNDELCNIIETITGIPPCKNGMSTFFCEKIPFIYAQLKRDAQFFLENDPAAQSIKEIYLSYPGFFAISIYRFAHQLHIMGIPLLPRMFTEYAHSKTGIDIHPSAQIGCPFFIDHGTGIVVGETTVMKNGIKLYQGVTLGALSVSKSEAGMKRHPTIEDNVVIYAGATILGGSTVIGRNSIIGGNAWITKSVEAFSKVFHKGQIIVKDND